MPLHAAQEIEAHTQSYCDCNVVIKLLMTSTDRDFHEEKVRWRKGRRNGLQCFSFLASLLSCKCARLFALLLTHTSREIALASHSCCCTCAGV